MPVPADDDVVMHRDPERLCDLRDLPRHLDVGTRRRRVAGGMVVHQNDGGRGQFQCAFDHFARIDRRMIDCADLLDLVDDELVAFVEKQDAKLLPLGKRHRGAAIVEHRRPRRQHVTAFHLAAGEPKGGGLDHLEFRDGGIAEPVALGKTRPWRRDHVAERAESRDQRLRQRLDVPPGQRAKQHQFEKLIVGDRSAAGLAKTLAQALPMAVIMRRRFGDAGLTTATIFDHERPAARPCPHPAWGHFRPACNCYLVPPASGEKDQEILYGGRSSPFGDNVKISTPESMTPTVCSNCAESDRSRVTAVQPSDNTFTWGRPRLIMGSTVNSMPGRNTVPSPRRPTWTILGSSWNRRPSPWPQKSRTTLICWASTKVWLPAPISPLVPPGPSL